MQNSIRIVTAALMLCFAACKHATSVEGTYKAVGAGIGVSQNSYLSITKKGEDYEVCVQDGQDNSKYSWTAQLQGDKLAWTDKSIPMEISFDGKYATMKTAGGVMGQYKFEKVDSLPGKPLQTAPGDTVK